METCDQSCPTASPVTNTTHPFGNTTCMDGKQILTVHFNYISCTKHALNQCNVEDERQCICDPTFDVFDDCFLRTTCFSKCKIASNTIVVLQLIIIVTALILNIIICYAYLKNATLRKKNPNLLLFNQAIVDLVNVMIYGLPNVIILIVTFDTDTLGMSNTTLIVTAASSYFLFTIIAIERFVSLYKPIWHRVHVTKRRLMLPIAISWFLSVLLSVLKNYVPHSGYMYFLLAIMVILQISTSVLHIWTFVIAYRAVYSRPTDSNNLDIQTKKELRVVILFVIMYLIFVLGSEPLQWVVVYEIHFYSLRSQTLFTVYMLPSLLNPLLVLCLKEEFRMVKIGCKSTTAHNDSHNVIHLDQRENNLRSQ